MSFANRAHKAIAFPAAGMISCGWMMWDAEGAFNDRTLAQAIAEFKGRFFRENDGNPIDYTVAISGALQLVPDAEALNVLEADYKKMADDGILLDDAEPFADLIKRCADLEQRANAKAYNLKVVGSNPTPATGRARVSTGPPLLASAGPEPIKVRLAENIARTMKRRALTHAAAAALIGATQPDVSKMLREISASSWSSGF